MDPTASLRKRCQVLLVEDNLADANLLRWAFADAEVHFEFHVARDSEAAFEFLGAQATPGSAGAPDLVLLDLNLPGRDGREILQEIRASPRWASTPVIVLTSSQAQADVKTCLEMQANHYLTKPLDLLGYEALARSIVGYWVSLSDSARAEPAGEASQAS